MSRKPSYYYHEDVAFHWQYCDYDLWKLDKAVELAKQDLRIVRKMKHVADYFKSEIAFARSSNLNRFIINYDDTGLFIRLVNDVLRYVENAPRDLLLAPRNYPFAAAYFVKWLLPNDIRFFATEKDANNEVGVEFRL